MSTPPITEITPDVPAPVRVVEEMARAIYEQRNGFGCMPWTRRDEQHRRPYRSDAKAALMVLRRHGFVTLDCINAIYAEEDANGEPRSSAHTRRR